MIRVAVLDDHHAVRLGLDAALSAEADMEPVGAAATAAQLDALLYRTAPNVVIVDYRLPDDDGLSVCRRLKKDPLAPAVLLHSAFADDWLTVPALVAGTDGIVHKAAPGRELAEAVRSVAGGGKALPRVLPEYLTAASDALAAEDRPILGMLVHDTPLREIAETLGMTAAVLNHRLERMLRALRTPVGDVAWVTSKAR